MPGAEAGGAGLAAADVTAEDVARARAAIGDVARHTPVLPSATLTERCGGEVVLKAESLQRTGAFKIRGALAKLAALGAYLHPMTPAEVTAFAQEQQRTWRPVAERIAKQAAEQSR